MCALHHHGFPTPIPYDQNRHIVAMSRIHGLPISQIRSGKLEDPKHVFLQCVNIISRLAAHGLIHCDFNEFNLMIDDQQNIILIDFPQMVSVDHPNAEELFERDINGLVKFFATKMRYIAAVDVLPNFSGVIASSELMDDFKSALSAILDKSGFSKEDHESLDAYLRESAVDGDDAAEGEYSDDVDKEDVTWPGMNHDSEAEASDALDVPCPEMSEMTEITEGQGDTTSTSSSVFGIEATLTNPQLIRARTLKGFQMNSASKSRNSTKKRNKYGRIVKDKVDF